MFGRKSTTGSGGPIAAPSDEAPPAAPEPAAITVRRNATVTRSRLVTKGDYSNSCMYFSVIAKDPEATSESEAEGERIFHGAVDVTPFNGFATLEPGDQLSVVLTKTGEGYWQTKEFDYVVDAEKERARLSELQGKPEDAAALPPRHPLRTPR